MNLFTKQTHRLREGSYGCQREGYGGGIVREFGMDMYPTAIFKTDNQ